jgi:BirA family biotin operon repressor/biotin-[acetyl-CoA-carboxylase] ligase
MNTIDAALISVLRNASVHLPGSELAALLRIGTDVVVAHVQALCDAGFEIENRPGLGYRLLRSPDRLIADDLKARLGQLRSVRDVIVFEETDSTNEQAAKIGEAGAPGGLAIFARGRPPDVEGSDAAGTRVSSWALVLVAAPACFTPRTLASIDDMGGVRHGGRH